MQDISTIAQNGYDLRKPGMVLVPPHPSLPYNYTGYYNEVQGTVVTRVRAREVSESQNPAIEISQSQNSASGLRSPPFPQELSRFAAGTC